MRRWIALMMLVGLSVAGCRIETVDRDPLAGVPNATPSPDLDSPIRPGDPRDNGDRQLDPDTVVRAALDDVQAFWARIYPDVYRGEFHPLRGGYKPYGPDQRFLECGELIPYRAVSGNAFYCPTDDSISWDEVNLTPGLLEQFGAFTLGIVFAHELGHAVQVRAGVRAPTIVLELQADCFAGAWTKDVEDGNSSSFTFGSPDDLDNSVGGFLELRDGVGEDTRSGNAHGSGFDRVGAFQDGLDHGATACRDYENDPPQVFEFPFTTVEDLQNQGNLPFEEVAPDTVQDLELYWKIAFDQLSRRWDPIDHITPYDPASDTVTCGHKTLSAEEAKFDAFYCVADDTIAFDNRNLMPELYDIGDFAMGFEIARQYALAAQVQLGNLATDEKSDLQADCMVGAYEASTLPGSTMRVGEDQRVLTASPGDLDEAIVAFLVGGEKGSAFDRIAAFRKGVTGDGSLEVCGV